MKVELQQSDGRRHVTADHKALVSGILEWLTFAREGDKVTLTALGDSHHVKLVKLAKEPDYNEARECSPCWHPFRKTCEGCGQRE